MISDDGYNVDWIVTQTNKFNATAIGVWIVYMLDIFSIKTGHIAEAKHNNG